MREEEKEPGGEPPVTKTLDPSSRKSPTVEEAGGMGVGGGQLLSVIIACA